MSHSWRAFVFLVLVVAMLGSAWAQSPFALSVHEKPAGCHQHGNSSPSHSPNDHYQCCIAGHESAIVQASVVPHVMPEAASPLTIEPAPQHVYIAAVASDIASSSPPGAIPLRI
jgi:hypothetical protein